MKGNTFFYAIACYKESVSKTDSLRIILFCSFLVIGLPPVTYVKKTYSFKGGAPPPPAPKMKGGKKAAAAAPGKKVLRKNNITKIGNLNMNRFPFFRRKKFSH